MATLPVQRTWTVGETVTAAMLNDDVRDAVNFFLNAPTALAYNAAIAVATGGAGTFFTLASERYDNDGIHSTVTNTGRLTVVTAGVYSVNAYLSYAGNATGTKRNLAVRLNGTTVLREVTVPPDAANATTVALSFDYKLAATDYLELRAFHDGGVNINVTPELGMTWQSVG